MLHNIIQNKKNEWLQSSDCTIFHLIDYIRDKDKLREAQIEAIETYLFLKIEGKNKPLWQLYSEGFFIKTDTLSKEINQNSKHSVNKNMDALELYGFFTTQTAENSLHQSHTKAIESNSEGIDYCHIIKSIFYNVNYSDYLMSLPMGAGKTYLMAAFIYLDLYFAINDSESKIFAHNFLVLIPSGLKSSIIPSLKTIEHFDPTWILPEPAASNIKKILKFDFLDDQKSGKKSNKARNPNAQKINTCLPNPFGQVFVVNAEKVILENFITPNEFDHDEEIETKNDLKKLIGQISNLSILIDEVHHATTNDIKLRQAVNYWHKRGNITSVIGFSGTPYLQKQEAIKIGEKTMKLSQITNTVYYYPLLKAIEKFLKAPTVKIGENLDRFEIIRKGIEDFDTLYKDKVYDNGAIAKIAIYCSNIETLEEEVYPFLTGDLRINPIEILKYHGGNKRYSLPKESELAFRTLDLPISKKRYILLVQVGKEGWDCPSLTAVVLSQKGDSPQNMVLQTACRCLRQVDKGRDETALIWLNKENADILNKQLKKEQNSNISELIKIKRPDVSKNYKPNFGQRKPPLSIPVYSEIYPDGNKILDHDVKDKVRSSLHEIISLLDRERIPANIISSEISSIDFATRNHLHELGREHAQFNIWLFQISKESFNSIKLDELQQFYDELIKIFHKITFEKEGNRYFNELYNHNIIQSKIRLALNREKLKNTDARLLSTLE